MLFVVWSLLTGCVAPSLRDTGSSVRGSGNQSASAGCEVVETRTVGFDEDVGGYTAADMLGVVLGTHSKTLTWNSGATTGLSLSLTGATQAVFVDEEVPATGGPTVEIACTDSLQIAMDVQVVTVDGQLNFEAPVVVRSSAAGWQELTISLDRPDVLFRATDWVTEPHDTLSSSLSAVWTDGVMSGSISALAERSSGTGPESVVLASNIEIAVF